MVTTVQNIYLAEDDEDDIFFFQYAIEKLMPACNLKIAQNGLQLIDLIRNSQTSPDLMFIDINMPMVDGFETLSRLKSMPGYKQVPTIVYSTSRRDEDVIRAYKVGASAYLVKPLELESLEKAVQKVLHLDWKSYTVPSSMGEFVLQP